MTQIKNDSTNLGTTENNTKKAPGLAERMFHSDVGASISRTVNKTLLSGDDKVLGESVRDFAVKFAKDALNPSQSSQDDVTSTKGPTTLLHNDFGRSISKLANKYLVSGEDKVLGESVRNVALKFAQDALNTSSSPKSSASSEPGPTTLIHNAVGRQMSKAANWILNGEQNKLLGDSIRDFAIKETHRFINDVKAKGNTSSNEPTPEANSNKPSGLLGKLVHNDLNSAISKFVNKHLVTGEDKVLGASLRDSAVKFAQEVNDPNSTSAMSNAPTPKPTTLLHNSVGNAISKTANKMLNGEDNKLLGDSFKDCAIRQLRGFIQEVKGVNSAESANTSHLENSASLSSPASMLSKAIDKAEPTLSSSKTKESPTQQESNDNQVRLK